MMKIIIAPILLSSTPAQAAPRPELPQCTCLQTWPHSDNAAMWAKSYGDVSNFGWSLAAANANGCTQVSSYWDPSWGEKADAYQFCVPDTTNGACIGLGGYDAYSMSFHMFCGQQRDTANGIAADATGNTAALTADQKLAAMAYSDAIAIATQLPPCSCEADWSSSKLAQTYCGSDAALAKGAVGNTTCANAPMAFSNVLNDASNGTFNYGYYRAEQTPAQVYTIAKWCKVPLEGCAVAMGGKDACTEERWMATHTLDLATGNEVEVSVTMPVLEYSNGVNGVASRRSRQVLAKQMDLKDQTTGTVAVGDTVAVAMTFLPENVNSYIGNTENLMLAAQAAAKVTMDSYDKINWVEDHMGCDAACRTQREADAIVAKNVSDMAKAQAFQACDENAICKEKQDFWLNCYKPTPAPPTPAPPTPSPAPVVANDTNSTTTNSTTTNSTTAAPVTSNNANNGVASGAFGMKPLIELAGIVAVVAASSMF